VVRGGDRDGIDIGAIKQAAKIGYLVELAPVRLLKLRGPLGEHTGITIAKGYQLILKAMDMTLSAAVEANHGHPNLAVNIGPGRSRKNGAGGCRARRLLQKYTTRLLQHGNAPGETSSGSHDIVTAGKTGESVNIRRPGAA
jgi:hypothetical protein